MDGKETFTFSQESRKNLPVEMTLTYFFVFVFWVPVVGKGITRNWDAHYWGYIARKVARDVMMMGIYGHRDWCGLYLLVVVLCKRAFPPFFGSIFRLMLKKGKRSRYGGKGGDVRGCKGRGRH